MICRRIVEWLGVLFVAGNVGAPAAQAQPAETSEQTRQLYQSRCALCHGADGTPKPIAKGAPTFTDPGWAPSVETIVTVLTDGKGRTMPKFKGRLTAAEMQALAAYLLEMKGPRR